MAVVHASMEGTAKAMARVSGMPDYRFVDGGLPAHPTCGLDTGGDRRDRPRARAQARRATHSRASPLDAPRPSQQSRSPCRPRRGRGRSHDPDRRRAVRAPRRRPRPIPSSMSASSISSSSRRARNVVTSHRVCHPSARVRARGTTSGTCVVDRGDRPDRRATASAITSSPTASTRPVNARCGSRRAIVSPRCMHSRSTSSSDPLVAPPLERGPGPLLFVGLPLGPRRGPGIAEIGAVERSRSQAALEHGGRPREQGRVEHRRPGGRYGDARCVPGPRVVAIACIVGVAILASAVTASAGDTPTPKSNVQHLHFALGPLDIHPGQNLIETNTVPDPAAQDRRLDRGVQAQPAARRRHRATRRRDPPAPRCLAHGRDSTPPPRRCRSGSSASARRRPRCTCHRDTATGTRRPTTGGSTT